MIRILICDNCNEEFKSPSPKKRFCCLDCKKEYIERTWNEYETETKKKNSKSKENTNTKLSKWKQKIK